MCVNVSLVCEFAMWLVTLSLCLNISQLVLCVTSSVFHHTLALVLEHSNPILGVSLLHHSGPDLDMAHSAIVLEEYFYSVHSSQALGQKATFLSAFFLLLHVCRVSAPRCSELKSHLKTVSCQRQLQWHLPICRYIVTAFFFYWKTVFFKIWC